MVVKEESKGIVVYPTTDKVNEDTIKEPSVVVTSGNNSVSLIHRRIDSSGNRQIVPFMSLKKEQLQKYINILQDVCDKL